MCVYLCAYTTNRMYTDGEVSLLAVYGTTLTVEGTRNIITKFNPLKPYQRFYMQTQYSLTVPIIYFTIHA